MPEMNGIELLREIKARYPDLKVYMITAYGDEENFRMTRNLGATDYSHQAAPIRPAERKTKLSKCNLREV